MKKIYGKSEDWNQKNWKASFENLVNDGYSLERIELKKWYIWKIENWKSAVLVNKNAHKVVKETEKAIQFSIVNQYGNEYEMWFPKSTLESY